MVDTCGAAKAGRLVPRMTGAARRHRWVVPGSRTQEGPMQRGADRRVSQGPLRIATYRRGPMRTQTSSRCGDSTSIST